MKPVNGRNFVTHEMFESEWSNGAMSKRYLRHVFFLCHLFLFLWLNVAPEAHCRCSGGQRCGYSHCSGDVIIKSSNGLQDESIIFLLGFKLFPLLFQVFSCFSFAIPLFFSRPTHIQHVELKFVRMKSKKWRRPCQRPHLKELRRDCVFSPGRGEELSVVSLRCREVGCEGKSSAWPQGWWRIGMIRYDSVLDMSIIC